MIAREKLITDGKQYGIGVVRRYSDVQHIVDVIDERLCDLTVRFGINQTN